MSNTSVSIYERRFLASILASIVLFVGMDLFNDSLEGVKWTHLILELVIALCAALGIFILMKDSFKKSHQLVKSQELILATSKELERWKLESQKYIQGLSDAIDAQLARWALSPSEKEVALLILKGLSLKEIAEIRKTSEKTVSAQSVAIYSKSGLGGRSELSAYFLEDLLAPQEKGPNKF
jgi:DNA-binding CsgD family transcriptional regulator